MAELEIFVSWSKSGSRQIAEALKEWLPHVLPGAKPWMSSEDITKGVPWLSCDGASPLASDHRCEETRLSRAEDSEAESLRWPGIHSDLKDFSFFLDRRRVGS
jgi:hypothetical protein